jgi:hypothetical protein
VKLKLKRKTSVFLKRFFDTNSLKLIHIIVFSKNVIRQGDCLNSICFFGGGDSQLIDITDITGNLAGHDLQLISPSSDISFYGKADKSLAL